MKKISLILTLIFIVPSLVYSQEKMQGDLSFLNQSNIQINVNVESETIPFEGLNRYAENNRCFELQNGVIFRFYYTENTYHDWQITKNTFTVNPGPELTMIHCSANLNTGNLAYGYGKYKVTITTPNNVVYISYFNNLDSKYGTTMHGTNYSYDFRYEFNSENQPVEFLGNGNHIDDVYPYIPGYPIKEFKVWRIIQPVQEEPRGNEFYARTVPFGYRPDIPGTFSSPLSIGKRVIFDTVYKYTNLKYGYNTINYDFNYYEGDLLPIEERSPGNTYTTPSLDYGILEFYADEGSIFDLRKDKRFWICGYDNDKLDIFRLKAGSKIILGKNSKIQTYNTGKFIDEGSIKELSPETLFRAWQYSSIELSGNNVTHTFNNSSNMIIDGGATLKVGDNTIVVFDGENTKLQLKPQSIVQLGTNAQIKFTNGAYLGANGATFSSLGSSAWSGIEFENAGSLSNVSTISNCTFNNAITPININNSGSSANNSISITGNTFNLPSSGSQGIHGGNVYNLLVQNNIFNMPSNIIAGLYIQNSGTANAAGNSNVNSYNLNIIGNTFSGGHIGMILNSNTNLIPFYIYGNIFNNNSSYNILARLISGDIKNNSSNINNVNYSFYLVQSHPNLYANNVYASQANIFSCTESYPRLSPVIDHGESIWLGGANILHSSNDNILFNTASYAFLDRGLNLFSKSNPASYHLYGDVHVRERAYYVRGNCFNGQSAPRYDLWEGSNIVTPIWDVPVYYCNASTDDGIGWEISDKGFGIVDSILVTNPISGQQITSDEELYAQASREKISGNYSNAISDYRLLIDNYDTSINIYPSLSELYECYQGLDTSSEQNNRNVLYGNLLTYLNNKITSGIYDYSFIDIAYNLTLMCYKNMTEYTEAKDGYEYIALYNPDPTARLYASFDYSIIEALLNSGGSVSSKTENESDETFLKNRINRLEKLISGDPVKQILKKSYNLKKEENERNLNKEIEKKSSDKKSATKMIDKIKSEENNINSRILSNIRSLNKMTAKDKEKKKLEDILYAAKISSNRMNRKNLIEDIIPLKYELSQNYPNPFNPVTKISYDLPKSGLVKLMVYDILGREIKNLVNEFKQAGRYTVEFDGSYFASGVYFYRIQAGDFMGVKRMLMIK